MWRCGPKQAKISSFLGFLDHTQRRITIGSTSLDEWSVRRRDLYLTTHNTQHRQTSMPPAGFEPTIPARKRPQTHALDRAGTGIAPTTPSPSSIMCKHSVSSFPSSSCPVQCAGTIHGGARVSWHSLFNHRNATHAIISSYLWDSTCKHVGMT